MAFTVTEGGETHLWRSDVNGSPPKQLESQGLYATAPRFGGGAGIVYGEFDEQERVNHIWRVDPDGGKLRQVTHGKGETLLSVARDGSKLLFQRWGDPTALWSLDLQEGAEPKLLASDSIDQIAQISSDGRWICCGTFTTVQDRIYTRQVVIPAEGGPPVAQFLLPPGTIKSAWSADNTSLTYVDRNKDWNLMRQAVAGGEPTPLTRFTAGQITEFAWSPDGRKLAVVRRIGKSESVWVVAPGGGEPKQVAQFSTGSVADCRWSLDGKHVIFTYGTATQDVVLISDVA